jgi:hypothetical protein
MPIDQINRHERASDTDQVKVLEGIFRLLPVYVLRSNQGIRIKVFPLKLLVWIVGLGCATYLGGGLVLFLHDRYRVGLVEISLVDRLYPPNWGKYREARGNAYITMAEKSLESGSFSNAFHQLKVGLARAPQHKEGRLLYSEMLKYSGRPDLCEEVLVKGIEFHGHDQKYTTRVLSFLFQYQKDTTVIEVVQQLLEHPRAHDSDIAASDSANSTLLATALATAHFYRGNFDQAEQVLTNYGQTFSSEGRLLLAKIEWDRGYRVLALALIEQLSKEFPENPSIYRTVVQWQLAESLTDSARRTSLLRRIRYPEQFQPRIDLMYSHDKSGDTFSTSREIEEYFRDFGDFPDAILMLGDFAANTGNPTLAARIFDHSKSHSFQLQASALMMVEAEIVAKNYETAIEKARTLIETHPDWETQLAPVFNGLQAIAHFARGDRESANLYLNSFLNLPSIRAENLVAVAKRLESVGAHQESRRVLAQAVQTDPLNQPALARLIENDLQEVEAPELSQNLKHMLEMRRPSPELLKAAYQRLGLDQYMFIEGRDELLDTIATALSGQTVASN